MPHCPATTDGADVLAAAGGPIVAASSSSTDGADVLAASLVAVGAGSFSAALIEAADVLAAAAGPLVAASSSTTDGADILAAADQGLRVAAFTLFAAAALSASAWLAKASFWIKCSVISSTARHSPFVGALRR